jgi:type VI secretion system ImpM family protein
MFGLLGRKARSEVGPVAGFGKIPALGDFVRTPSPSDEMIAFEAWVTRAMETAEARSQGTTFKEAFTNGAPHAFLWSGAIDKKHRGLLAGVVAPSHDAVGRHFPVVLCAPLPIGPLAAHPHALPLLLHEFFQQTASAAARAARTHTQAEFHAQVASTAPPSLEALPGTLASYGTWARGVRATEVWSALFGDDAGRAARWALYLLVEATATYRGQDAPPLPLGLRVPLGADLARMAAMWIDLARHAAGWKATVPTFFVPLGRTNGHALLQLGAEAPPTVVADLFTPSAESDDVCDLTPREDTRLPSVLPTRVDRATAEDGAPMSDVIDQLGR